MSNAQNALLAASEIKTAVASFLASNPHDGGTCNMDSVKVACGTKRASTVLKMFQDAGAEGFVGTRYGKKVCYLQCGENRFQGFPRTRIVEIARDVLKRHGFEASVEYVVD